MTIRLLLAAVLALAPTPAADQARVSSDDVKAHLLSRVEPVVPPQATAAKIGGDVVAEAVIGPKGTVTSLRILGGHEMLHASARAAMMQWTFRPFLQNGKPAAVLAILEVAFPDAKKAEAFAAQDAFESTMFECQKALDATPIAAEAPCARAVAASEGLDPDRVVERTMAMSKHALALANVGKNSDAAAIMARVVAVLVKLGPNDSSTGSAQLLLAMLYARSQEAAKADEAYQAAIDRLTTAMNLSDFMGEQHAEQLREAIRTYATFKRDQGDAAAAIELEARAAATVAPEPKNQDGPVRLRLRSSLRWRSANGIVVLEPADQPLRDTDLTKIRAALPKDAKLWMIKTDGYEQRANDFVWLAECYLEPSTTSATLRRGAIFTAIVEQGSTLAQTKWKTVDNRQEWLELAPFAAARTDLDGLIQLLTRGDLKFTDQELDGIIAFVREQSQASTRVGPSQIRSWRIRSINRVDTRTREVDIYLDNPQSERPGQSITLRPAAAGGWTVFSVRQHDTYRRRCQQRAGERYLARDRSLDIPSVSQSVNPSFRRSVSPSIRK